MLALSVRALADVGAQVVSLRQAEQLPSWLRQCLVAAEPLGLGSTAERGGAGWCHFYAPDGLTQMQRCSLDEAQPEELHFNRRVVELTPCGNGASMRWRVGHAGQSRRSEGSEEFDLVIFAGTARDAIGLDGLRDTLSPSQQRELTKVGYDHRLAVALVLKPELGTRLEELCKGRCELSFGDDSGKVISLMVRQESKGRAFGVAASVVILHSTPAFAARNLQASKQARRPPSDLGRRALLGELSGLLRMQVRELETKILDSKTVHWRQAQVVRGYNFSAEQIHGCLVAGAAPNLLLAGDYLAGPQIAGSFEGCLASAEAAAQRASDHLFGVRSELVSTTLSACVPPSRTKTEGGSIARAPRAKRWQRKVVSEMQEEAVLGG